MAEKIPRSLWSY